MRIKFIPDITPLNKYLYIAFAKREDEHLETPFEKLSPGSTFAARFQIIEELGKGGMGEVYKVHDTEIKEKVALKLLKPKIASNKKTIERKVPGTPASHEL